MDTPLEKPLLFLLRDPKTLSCASSPLAPSCSYLPDYLGQSIAYVDKLHRVNQHQSINPEVMNE